MTKQELIDKLSLLHTGDDERDHINADDLLLEYINDKDISEAFECIEKWYA